VTGTREARVFGFGSPVGWDGVFYDAKPCSVLSVLSRFQRSVIKKRLALAKQVLLLSARHFYIRRPFPLLRPCSSFLSLSSHVLPPFLAPLDCRLMPSCQPAAVSTESLSNAANGAVDGRISNSTPGPACVLAIWLAVPDPRHSFRRLDELLDCCVARLMSLGHEGRLQHDGGGGGGG
jgi:hypothetical protein